MNSIGKSMLLDELFALCGVDKERKAKLLEKLDRMAELLLALNVSSRVQIKMIVELRRLLSDRDALIENLLKENTALKGQKKLSNKNCFGAQKRSFQSRGSDSRESDKDDFDSSSAPGLPSENNEMDILPSLLT